MASKPKCTPTKDPRALAQEKLSRWLAQDPILMWVSSHYMLLEGLAGSAFRDSLPAWWWLVAEGESAKWKSLPQKIVYPPFCMAPESGHSGVPLEALPECLAALSILAGTSQTHLVDVAVDPGIRCEPDRGRAGAYLTLPDGPIELNGVVDYMWDYDQGSLRGWTMSVEAPPTLTYRGNQDGLNALLGQLKRWFPIDQLVGAHGSSCQPGATGHQCSPHTTGE
jgi:hypothetical protein